MNRRKPIRANVGKPIQVLIVEDDFYSAYTLNHLIYRDTRTTVCLQVDTTRGLMQAIEALPKGRRPQVALVDAEMAETEPALGRLITDLKARLPGLEVVCLSQYGRPAQIDEALSARASGFLIKNEIQVAAAAAVVAARHGYFVVTPSAYALLADQRYVIHKHIFRIPRWTRAQVLADRYRLAFYLTVMYGMDARLAAEELDLSQETIETYRKETYRLVGNSVESDPSFAGVDWEELTPMMKAFLNFTQPADPTYGLY
jgi:DNA-binding NarL/FixJ family response regulator